MVWSFGPYRMEELIARGGMGEVHRAHDERHDRVVAVKLLNAELADDVDFRERFKREARAAARLREPHVVPIHAYGEIDGRLYLDMRLVEGRDLDARLREQGGMSAADAVDVVGQIASALDAAHAERLVHRDVKPSNVIVTADGFAYLVDFGIARTISPHTDLTSAGDVVGTLHYMAPERFGSEPIDHRVDVYSLACVLFQCLTGVQPFRGENPLALMYAHANHEPPRPGAHRSELAAFDRVIATGMAKDPAHRFASTGDLARAAKAALGQRESTPQLPAPPPLAPPAPAPHPPLAAPAPSDPSPRPTLAAPPSESSPRPTLAAPPSTPSPRPTLAAPSSTPSPRPTLAAPSSTPSPRPTLAAPPSAPSPRPTLAAPSPSAAAPRPTLVAPSSAPAQSFSPPPRPPKRRGAGRWVAVAAVAVLLLGVGGFLLYKDKLIPGESGASAPPSSSTRPRPPASTTSSADLGLGTPISSPPCDGRYIVIVGSAVSKEHYAADIRRFLDEHPGAKYLHAASTGCSSLRQVYNDGTEIYAAYYGPYTSKQEACARKDDTGGGAFVRTLDNTTSPEHVVSCET